MRAAIVAFGLVLLAGPVSAQSQNEGLLQHARAVARVELIEQTCGKSYVIDYAWLHIVRRGITEMAVERYGEPVLWSTVERVRPEFMSEIREAGAASWCPVQREHYRQPGPGAREMIGPPIEKCLANRSGSPAIRTGAIGRSNRLQGSKP